MCEVQDILDQYGDEYLRNHTVTPQQYKAIMAIRDCRTSALGGHVDECDDCGYSKNSYNSCKNRNCPKCQTFAKEKWIDARKEDLLDVPYFHVVFTIPEELNMIGYQNQKIVYKILFDAVAETLSELAADPEYLGAQIGFTQILHTWGQNLMLHQHTHVIVPAGGVSRDGKFVISSKDFFIPVRVLSSMFRGKFLYMLKKKYKDLEFYGSVEEYNNEEIFLALINDMYKKGWIVYCKKTFTSPEAVIEYLGRYTHRVALSNNRIVSIENGNVTFKWLDYRDNKEKIMTITAEEFIRRFLMHVLPKRFMKIRHYGLLANCNRNTKLRYWQKIVGCTTAKSRFKGLNTVEIMQKITGKDVTKCPCCLNGKMKRRKLVYGVDIPLLE